MRNIPFGSVGILQIDDVRYGFRPLEVYSEFGQPPIMKGEFFQDVFQASNRYQGTGVAYGKIPEPLAIKNVIFNDPATVVMWNDGTKTVVKCQPGDIYSKETGLALCIAKKYLGNKGNFNEVFKKWLPEEVESVEEYDGIKVGDTVSVVDPGKSYTTYREWVMRNVPNPILAARYAECRKVKNGVVGRVRYIAPHGRFDSILAYIDSGKICYLVSIDGLEKVEEG